MKVGTTADRIIIEYDIRQAPQRIWAALTAPDAITAWWGGHVSLDAKAGGSFREEWTDEMGRRVVTTGTVSRCEPPEFLELSWADEDWPQSTQVSMVLDPVAETKTLLRLEHRGWSVLPADRRQRLIEQHAAGWHHHLRDLEAYLGR
ncbi:SRPBCC family protein [Microvirga calopogonii]|uniref:SRPBCC family protein n=1 Tax=Microvirga calopogonii TaxID=2078013 RepID=UPI000E0D590E|nr:SRPBCC domain-containing protein [Microvirga calopogonii]